MFTLLIILNIISFSYLAINVMYLKAELNSLNIAVISLGFMFANVLNIILLTLIKGL